MEWADETLPPVCSGTCHGVPESLATRVGQLRSADASVWDAVVFDDGPSDSALAGDRRDQRVGVLRRLEMFEPKQNSEENYR